MQIQLLPFLTAWLWASYFPLISLWALILRTGPVPFLYCRGGDEDQWESSRQELSWACVLAAVPGARPCSHGLVADERLPGVSDHIRRRKTHTGSPEREAPDHTSVELLLISARVFSSLPHQLLGGGLFWSCFRRTQIKFQFKRNIKNSGPQGEAARS